MDYEKKYEEALERMKSWARGEHPECFTEAQKTAEFIFPELAEVDGEWIRKNLINVFKDEYGTNTYFVGMKVKDIIAWLEKQGDKDKLIQDLGKYKVKYTQEVLEKHVNSMSIKNDERLRKTTIAFLKDFAEQGYENAVECIDWLEKQGEQVPTDKVEPKFKVGDWITDNNSVFQIVRVEDEWYYVDDGDKICFDVAHQYYRLWTIKDAKDGDVLATDYGVFIYAKVLYGKPYAYCGVDKFGVFKDNCLNNNWTNSVDNIHPATKERRDLLFQKMKEAGYRWENNQLEEINNKGFVDLGLPSGTLWATCNLGAEKETDFGLFYQWGDTKGYNPDEGHDFNWDNYKWGAFGNFTKYNNSDGKLVLDNDDDPVFVATNGMFKLPTKEQLQELIDHTNHEWRENFKESGVKGMKFTNKSDDTKYIFIPAAGFCGNGGHNDAGSWGCVWSAYCNEYGVDYAWNINFSVDYVGMDYFHRCDGFSVRGVLNK